MEEITKIIEKVLEDHGIRSIPEIEPREIQPSFEAFTDLSTRKTTLRYNRNFKPSKLSKTFRQKKNVTNPLHICANHITCHECGHIPNIKRSYCPGTIEEHEEHFVEPISAVLQPKGKLGAVSNITNLVEDLIDNTISAQSNHAGLTLFYDDVARTLGFKPAYEAYMRIQLYCWGDNLDKKLLTPHFTHNPEVIKATQSFLRKLEQATGRRKRLTKEETLKYLTDKEHWKEVSKYFTESIEPLITPSPNLPMCGFGKQMEKEMQDTITREKFARKNYNQGNARPSWMNKDEALDTVYSFLAKQIPLKVDTPRKARSYPLVPFGFTPFDPEEHNITDINFRKPIIIPDLETPFGIDNLTFGVAEHHIELPLLVKKGITHFPPFKCAYVDCSGSMQEGLPNENDKGQTIFIPWGDKSKYHFLCKTWYGIIEYLARQQILPNVNINLGTFSTVSRVTQGLEESKKLLLNPQFSGTSIDPNSLDQLLSGERSVFFTISDGDVENWNEVKESFIKKARDHNYFHIQLGKPSNMTISLQKSGLPVYQVSKGEDLERLSVDLTVKEYQKYIDQTLRGLK